MNYHSVVLKSETLHYLYQYPACTEPSIIIKVLKLESKCILVMSILRLIELRISFTGVTCLTA